MFRLGNALAVVMGGDSCSDRGATMGNRGVGATTCNLLSRTRSFLLLWNWVSDLRQLEYRVGFNRFSDGRTRYDSWLFVPSNKLSHHRFVNKHRLLSP
jgi:hypothetical protein